MHRNDAPLASARLSAVSALLYVAMATSAVAKDAPLRPGVEPAQSLQTGSVQAAPATPAAPEAAAARPDARPPSSGFVYVFDQDLRSFLSDYGRRIGLKPEIDGAVRGRLSRLKLPLDPPALLAELSGRFDIEWYLEGDTLRIAPRSELTTRVVSLRAVAYEDLLAALRASDVDVSRYPIRQLKESDAVIVRAPASYVARVVALVETLGRNGNDGVVKVIRFGVEKAAEPAKP